MAIRFKIDPLQMLKDAGYNTNRIRKEKLMGEAVVQQLRHGELVSWKNMNTLCTLLDCQIGDILEFVPDELTETAQE